MKRILPLAISLGAVATFGIVIGSYSVGANSLPATHSQSVVSRIDRGGAHFTNARPSAAELLRLRTQENRSSRDSRTDSNASACGPLDAPANSGSIIQLNSASQGGVELPLNSRVMNPVSYYQAVSGCNIVSIYSGSQVGNASVGVVVVWVNNPDSYPESSPQVLSLDNTGALDLQSVTGNVVSLTDENGNAHSLNISAMTLN